MSNHPTQDQKDRVRRRLNFDKVTNEPQNANIKESSSTQPLQENSEEEHNLVITDLSKMTREEKHEQIKKWNFDFENEVPLNGNWEWERVEPARIIDHKEKISLLDKDNKLTDRNI